MSFHLKPIEHQEHINFSFFDNNKDNKVKTYDIFSRVSNYLAISLFFFRLVCVRLFFIINVFKHFYNAEYWLTGWWLEKKAKLAHETYVK